MKQIRYTIWLALTALLLSGCSSSLQEGPEIPDSTPTTDFYHLHISFKNKNGEDLLQPLAYYRSDPTSNKYLGEVDPERCILKIGSTFIFDAEYSFFTLAKFDALHSWMTPDKNGMYENRYGNKGTWYLTSNYSIPSKKDGSPYSPLRYYICLPDLLSPTEYFELVTWWEEGTVDESGGERFPACVMATFDTEMSFDLSRTTEVKPVKGVTYNEKGEPYYVGYFLDIVLDRR